MSIQPYTCNDVVMSRPSTGETPKRNIRIEPEIWDPAKERADLEKRTMTSVVKTFLGRYGAAPPADAATCDPWDVVNLVMKELAAGKVGPQTNLPGAVDAAADMLRSLGINPVAKTPDPLSGS